MHAMPPATGEKTKEKNQRRGREYIKEPQEHKKMHATPTRPFQLIKMTAPMFDKLWLAEHLRRRLWDDYEMARVNACTAELPRGNGLGYLFQFGCN